MTIEVKDNPADHRFEAFVDGTPAGFALYDLVEGAIIFTHTEIGDAFEGKGVGGALARGALDEVRGRGLAVVPLCPFIKGWIEKHPDYQDLVPTAD